MNEKSIKKELTYSQLLEKNLQLQEELTKYKKEVLSLSKEKAFLDALLKNIPNSIYFKDTHSKFKKVSNSIIKAVGATSSSEVIGKSDFDFFKKESAQKYFDEEQEIIRSEKSIIDRIAIEKRKNGKETWAITSKMPLRDKNGVIIGTFGISSDITERRKAEQTIKESELKLRELNATKDKFFSIIAHDLKSPFSAMLGFSKLLTSNFEKYDLATQKEFISYIHQTIQNTYKLLENLLTWSRAQQGVISFKPIQQDLHVLVSETIELSNQTASNKSINLINKVPKNSLLIADRNMILTVLRNLINNAIKFTPKGGQITTIIENQNKKYSKISIIDNGIGISLKAQKKLFLIAENTSTQGTEKEQGTGLGLIVCKEFIEKHNGKIWVESEVGKGSKFSLTIPKKL